MPTHGHGGESSQFTDLLQTAHAYVHEIYGMHLCMYDAGARCIFASGERIDVQLFNLSGKTVSIESLGGEQ